MPAIIITASQLAAFGTTWINNKGALSRTPPYSSSDLGKVFDTAVANALAQMLGNIPVIRPNPNDLLPQHHNCVELGPVRVIGGVRPQNFDVGYRPDGIRFAFDSKTLNDAKSVGKNWQNMVNDLATEATTVHTRFPHAIVAFMVVIPTPCLVGSNRVAMVDTLERISRRIGIDAPNHLAEAISLALWDPHTGSIDPNLPDSSSILRIEQFSTQIEQAYTSRYKGLPPHVN
ncbi:MAG: hypothetical protein EI684_13725 [Candidatus Viridilinea halotolerans]|uniref:Restriction endonuclease n=1 Tax=Candidatus Viridilinea halotolerans TaxID=2491704 RepID=A0A426TXF0_9CHLR|nr:MAG: hypothetical protein EI684_13725 [Candidatus Viridilinea halotolerans]